MEKRPDREGGAAGRRLPGAEQLLAEGAGALVASIGRGGAGAEKRAKKVLEDVRRLRRMLLAAHQEKELVEQHQKRGGGGDRAAGDGSGVLDLDAARAEIGRRLARLRAAGDAGELSGEPER